MFPAPRGWQSPVLLAAAAPEAALARGAAAHNGPQPGTVLSLDALRSSFRFLFRFLGTLEAPDDSVGASFIPASLMGRTGASCFSWGLFCFPDGHFLGTLETLSFFLHPVLS